MKKMRANVFLQKLLPNQFISAFFTIFFLMGCGSFHRPTYDAPKLKVSGSYQATGEPQLYRNHRPGPVQLTWPVDQVRLTQEFSPSHNPRHQGLDFGGRLGQPIRSAHSGVVIYAGQDFSGYGKMIMIEYSSKWATLYAHLHRIKVKEGDSVSQGEVIGLMGRTGRATGVHLHFELIKNKVPLDPLPFLSETSSRITRY